MSISTDTRKNNRKMVDSGVEWIGEIPEGWEIKKLKDISEIGKGKPLPDEYDVVDPGKGTPYLNGGQNPSFFINLTGNTAAGTITISSGGASAGFSQLLVENTWVGGDCHTVTTKKLDQNYLAWALKGGEEVRTSNQTGTAMPHVNKSDLEVELVTIPPLPEQQAIASFLDHHTSLIDRERELISAKIEALREQRKALIFECVTGKRRIVEAQHLSDADDWSDIVRAGNLAAVPVARKDVPFVKEGRLVDSGVEWIGEIPEGWGVAKLIEIAEMQPRPQMVSKNDQHVDGGKPVITPGELINSWDSIVPELNTRVESQTVAKKGSVAVANIASIGKIRHLEEASVCNPQVVAYHTKKNGRWFFWAMFPVMEEAKNLANATTIPFINTTTLGNIRMAVPSTQEQKSIAAFLDHCTSLIDKKIALLVEKNNLLSEKRKALIFEAVTGKLDITG